MPPPTSVSVVGLHRIVPTKELVEETRDLQWGRGLRGQALKQADKNVREHFENLYLVVLLVEPLHAEIDWDAIAQHDSAQSRSNWQVPYDEQRIEGNGWVFWLHSVDLKQPLETELGPIQLPAPTPMPANLAKITYDAP